MTQLYFPRPRVQVTTYGADPSGTVDARAGVLAAIAAAAARGRAVVDLCEGRYLLSAQVALTASDLVFEGDGAVFVQGGTLGATDSSSLFRITGNDNLILGLEFDGNAAAQYNSRNRMIQINGTTAGTGSRNVLRGLYLHDSYNHASEAQASDLIQIVNGVDNLVEACRCVNAGWNGIRVSGDGNRIERNWVIDWLGRGIRFNGGKSGYVIGNHLIAEDVPCGAALLTDPETSQFGHWVCRDNTVYIKSNRVHAGSTGTNAIKIARTIYAEFSGNEVEIGLDSYSTGTITYDHTGGANERQVTLAGGTWPSWAKAPGRLFYNGAFYNLDARISDTILTLEGSGLGGDVSSPANFYIEQDYDNVGIRLEDGNDHVSIEGGRTDQILMTDGLMAGAISAHANNGSGKVRFTQTGHGWVAGDNDRIVYVTGASVLQYNTKHVFTYVNANTWDSNIDYVAGTIGSAKAHGATDILTVRGTHFGHGKHTRIAGMSNIKARVCKLDDLVFDQRYGEALLDDGATRYDPTDRVGATVAIEWAMPDEALDLFEVNNCEAIIANDGASGRLISLEDTATQLVTNAGKTRGRNNRVRNIGSGGSALIATTTNHTQRGFLFDTADGRTFWHTAAPTAGGWMVGDTCWNSAPAAGQPIGWKCTIAGTPGTWTAMANL